MLGYLKAAPTTYVLHYHRGRLVREGPGLTFFYFRPATTIVAVPLASGPHHLRVAITRQEATPFGAPVARIGESLIPAKRRQLVQAGNLEKARSIFRNMSGPGVYHLDGSLSREDVHEIILKKLIEGPLKAKRRAKMYVE